MPRVTLVPLSVASIRILLRKEESAPQNWQNTKRTKAIGNNGITLDPCRGRMIGESRSKILRKRQFWVSAMPLPGLLCLWPDGYTTSEPTG